jgi:hypothetical protein
MMSYALIINLLVVVTTCSDNFAIDIDPAEFTFTSFRLVVNSAKEWNTVGQVVCIVGSIQATLSRDCKIL